MAQQKDDGNSNPGGISNRGIDREREEQQHLPERGKSQDELSEAIDSVDGGSNPADDDFSISRE